MSLVDQRLDHIQHAANLFGRLRMSGSRFYIQRRHILLALCDVALRNHGRIDPLLIGFLDDLIIHICKIGYIVNLITLVLKISADSIENDHRSCIADMDKIINSRAADIHLHFTRL